MKSSALYARNDKNRQISAETAFVASASFLGVADGSGRYRRGNEQQRTGNAHKIKPYGRITPIRALRSLRSLLFTL